MAKFCKYCGSPVKETSSFCPNCGKALKASAEKTAPAAPAAAPVRASVPKPEALQEAKAVKAAVRQAVPAAEVKASLESGVMELGMFGDAGMLSEKAALAASDQVSGLLGGIFGSLFQFVKGFGRVLSLKNKKGLVFTAVISLLWAGLTFLNSKGLQGMPVRVLSFLTFTSGSRSLLDLNGSALAGDLLGKGLTAGFLYSIIDGGLISALKGAGRLFSKGSFSKDSFRYLLPGMGLALLVSYFAAPGAGLSASMAAVSGGFLALQSLGGRRGGFSPLIASLASKRINGVRKAPKTNVNGLSLGLALGFAAAVFLAKTVAGLMLPAGALLFALGMALVVLQKKPAQAIAASLVLVLSMTLPVFGLNWYDSIGNNQFKDLVSNNYQNEWRYIRMAKMDSYTYAIIEEGENHYINYCISMSDDMDWNWTTVSKSSDGEKPYSAIFNGLTQTGSRISTYAMGTGESDTFGIYMSVLRDGKWTEICHNRLDVVDDSMDLVEGEYTVQKGDEQVQLSIYIVPLGAPASADACFRVQAVFTVNDSEAILPPAEGSHTSHASDEAGDDGVEIPADIVEGPEDPEPEAPAKDETSGKSGRGSRAAKAGAAAAAAAAAAGAAGGSDPADPEEEKKKKRYKMYISKSFGGALRKGAQPISIKAWIAEIDEDGTERHRPDLTEKIQAATGYRVNIDSAVFEGGYCNLQISAQEEEMATQGSVTLTYEGEGGSFQRTVIFDLIGKPMISFPDSYENGQLGHLNSALTMDAIAGDRTTDLSGLFFIENAIGKPVSIEVKGGSDFVGTVSDAGELRDLYRVELTNTSEGASSDRMINPVRKAFVTIEAAFENGDIAYGNIVVDLYPEGLSFDMTDRPTVNGRLIVDTIGNPDPQGLDTTFKPASVGIYAAYYDGQLGKTVVKTADQLDIRIGELSGTDQEGHLLTDNFRYKESFSRFGMKLEPELTLPMPHGPYDVDMMIIAEADGKRFDKYLPLRILGEAPEPVDEWSIEVAKLKRTISNFGLPNHPVIRDLLHQIKELSPNSVKMIRSMIIYDAMEYYQAESVEMNAIANKLEHLETTFSVIKWFGDQAFSYLVTVYGGGPAVEAFATPLKGMFEEFAGLYAGQLIAGDPIDYTEDNFYKAILQGVENTLGNVLTGEELPSPQKVGYVVAACILTSFFRHYYYGDTEKGDLYKSMTAAGGDLSGVFVKNLLGEWFSAFIKKDAGFGKKVGDYIKTTFPDPDFFKYGDSFKSADAISKYFTETLGLGFGWLYDQSSGKITPTNPLGMKSAVFEEGTWAIRITIAGDYVLVFNLLDNIDYILKCFYDFAFGWLTADGSKVKVHDYEH